MSSKKMICDFYIRKKVSPNKPFLNQFYITVLALSFFLLLPLDQKTFQELVFKAVKNRKRSG